MAISLPTIPNPVEQKKPSKRKVIDNQKREINNLESEANKALQRFQKKLNETFKFVCALRLDMISDKLEPLNPELSKQLDIIANEIEKGEWEKIHS